MISRLRRTISAMALALLLTGMVVAPATGQEEERARRILEATGVRGGLVVHVGSGDGRLTAALRANNRYHVHGLDGDAADVERARAHIRARGLHGKVSVERWNARVLPYTDNLVNLLVSEEPGAIPPEEILRVLCPDGVAYVREGGEWKKTVKPRPGEIDEWTHYLHDATGNAVASDTVVGPPRHIRWVGSPRWSRHHDRMASMSALVSAGGRLFYIFDEGPMAAIVLPPKRALIARDAFNGVVLWKRPIPSWHTHLFPYKSGPAQLPRRLIAVGERVYATLGLHAPLTALDAATGETIRTYSGTRATEEVIASGGTLFLVVNESRAKEREYSPEHVCMHSERNRVAGVWLWNEEERRIAAVRAGADETLWSVKRRVVPLTLAANGESVYFHDGEKVVCLDRDSGDERWSSTPVSRKSLIPSNFGPTLVVHGDTVLFSGGNRSMTALSARTGEVRWSAPHARSGHHSPEDLLVVGGLVWSGATANGRDSGVFTGRDLRTGEVRRQFPPDVDTYWFHQRCYRSKATERFLLPSRTGIEFVDFRSKHWIPHHWVRGGCIYGIMPCNGLVYAPPHSCACYIDAKLNGFCALAAGSPSLAVPRKTGDDGRLERGPAYGEEGVGETSSTSAALHPGDWPTYRHDRARSGHTTAAVSPQLERKWESAPGGRLSSVVVAGGRVFVASVDDHSVHALDAESGKSLWSFTAGGRVDSPPTVHRGRLLFGSADGRVYCLRARDGKLIWRFRAAPVDRRLMSFEQLESVWPVHGSVLVLDDVVYCVAGRSMFLDGGMRFLRLDSVTGRKLSESILDERDPETGENLQRKVKGLNMPPALPDVLSSDGKNVYMRTQRFDLLGQRQEIGPTDVSEQGGEGAHLFSSAGFLDDTWFHRAYFMYGKSIASGANGWFLAGRVLPAGRLLVHDETTVYGYGRKPQYFRWSTPLEYQLFATRKRPEILNRETGKLADAAERSRRPEKCSVPIIKLAHDWTQDAPFHARALVQAGRVIFAAGPPDVLDEERAFQKPHDDAIHRAMEEQVAALEGRRGAILRAVSADDGSQLAEYRLDSVPVFDGMAAARGRLYISTIDGRVLCMAPGR